MVLLTCCGAGGSATEVCHYRDEQDPALGRGRGLNPNVPVILLVNTPVLIESFLKLSLFVTRAELILLKIPFLRIDVPDLPPKPVPESM